MQKQQLVTVCTAVFLLLAAAPADAQAPASSGAQTRKARPAARADAGTPAAEAGPRAPASAAPTPRTDEERTLYAMGMGLGRNLAIYELSPRELELFQRGLADAVTGAVPAVPGEVSQQRMQELARQRMARRSERLRVQGEEALAAFAKEEGAVQLPSGMVYREVTSGQGRSPSSTSTVRVHYRGTLVDGTEFDSSFRRGEPATFGLNQVIACWTQGLQRMKEGGKARLGCPAAVAYGESGSPPSIPPHATLFFDVELLEVR